jgi:hypothetical protein
MIEVIKDMIQSMRLQIRFKSSEWGRNIPKRSYYVALKQRNFLLRVALYL